MANPQLEDGFIRIANELLERYAQLNLSGAAFRVLFVIFREIWGYAGGKASKDDIWRVITKRTFFKMTGLGNNGLHKGLKQLLDKNIIERRPCEREWEYHFSRHNRAAVVE